MAFGIIQSGNKITTAADIEQGYAAPLGQGGEITYKPNRGQPIVNGEWLGGERAKAYIQKQLAISDPRKLLEQQSTSDVKLLEDKFSQAEQVLLVKPKNKTVVLQKEYKLRAEQLQRKYNVSVPAEKQQEHQRRFKDELDELATNFQIAQQRLAGEVESDLQELRAQKQQEIQKVQQEYRDKQIRLDTIDELEKNGTIVDPIQAKRERLQVAGIQLDISQMRAPQADPYRELQRTDTILRAIQNQLDQGIKYNFETGQIEGQLSDADKEQLVQMKNELTRYRLTYLLPTVMPQYENTYRNVGKLTAAAEQARGRVVPATGQQVGTIGTMVNEQKSKATAQSAKKVSDPLGLR